MSLSRWFGRFTVDASNDSFTVNATPLTLTAGNYFLDGYTGEGTSQLCELMSTAISTVVASSTVTLSATTNLITITFGSGTPSITWTDTDLRDLLGFTGNLSGAISYTATNEPRYTWSPDVAISDAPVSVARIVQPISSTIVHCSRDGTLTTVQGNTRYAADVSYQLIDGARVRIPSTGSVNKEFERFFEDVIAAGELIRLLPDKATYAAATDYITCCVGTPGEAIGAFGDFARKRFASYEGLYDLQIPIMEYVA